jgi:rhamnose transport system ATP-binding protein
VSIVATSPSQDGNASSPKSGSRPAVSCRGVGKRFGSFRALRDLDLDLEAAKVHGMVGENGAGKSTCLGILAGRIAASEGAIHTFGEELELRGDPRVSRSAGVVAIYQELTIVPALTAHANVFLGAPLTRRGLLSEREMRRRYVELCDRVGIAAVGPKVIASQLSVAEQQMLEILRALVTDARIILFDEPTASLAIPEREALLRLMRGLRDQGMTIAFVSHNLDEVLEISDSVTVFREGRLIASEPTAFWTKPRLVQAMLGRDASDRLVQRLAEADSAEPVPVYTNSRRKVRNALLEVRGLSVPGILHDVDLTLREGEIVGIGGLVGSGRTTLLRSLAGLEPHAAGGCVVEGRECEWPKTVRAAQARGIALVPEDRKGQGLALHMTAADNVTMSDWGALRRRGLVSPRRTASEAAIVAKKFGFDPARICEPAGNLSGGNQQKLLLARWAHSTPKILLADEPTRGIDIGAKEEIMAALEAMACDGLAVIFVSSELEEVAAISDRVVVLAEGRVAGTLDRADGEITMSMILHTVFKTEERDATV